MQLTIKEKDDRLEIIRISSELNLRTIPETFVNYIQHIRKIECESIYFKTYINGQFYHVKLKKELSEYIFNLIPVKDPRADEDTDQLIHRITKKYLADDGIDDIDVDNFDSEKKMILSILLEMGKIESRLESLDRIIEKRIEVTEDAFKSLENTLEEKYIEKKDVNIIGLLTNASKLDLVILFVVLLGLVIVVDTINIKRYIREYLDDPAYLVD